MAKPKVSARALLGNVSEAASDELRRSCRQRRGASAEALVPTGTGHTTSRNPTLVLSADFRAGSVLDGVHLLSGLFAPLLDLLTVESYS